MVDYLYIPGERRRALRWTDRHPQSRYGLGLLLYRHSGEILDGATFRFLRTQGAWLKTNKPDRARLALGLLQNESLGGDARARIA